MASLEPEKDTDLDVLTLVRQLDATIGWAQIPRWFQERGFKARLLLDQSTLLIKYEQFCQLWQPLWARQCRGIVFYRHPDDGAVVCIKSLLMRGSELQLKDGSSSSAVAAAAGPAVNLDAAQLESLAWLHRGQGQGDEKSDGSESFLSGKVDGSLLGVTLVPRSRRKLCAALEALIVAHGDSFANQVARYCTNLPYLAIFSSQGTLLLHVNMQAYAVTGILQGALDGAQVSALGSPEAELTGERGNVFFSQIDTFWHAHQGVDEALVSLSFEAVCARRTSAWGDEHTELAVCYDRSRLQFLGATLGMTRDSVGTFVPHARCAHPWPEPRVWTVSSGHRVHTMIDALEHLDQSTFLQQFPPDKDEQQQQQLDLEGFILMRYDGAKKTWCYSKLKTQAYYRTHRIDVANIAYLVRGGDMDDAAAERLPLVQFTRTFFRAFSDRFTSLSREVLDQIDGAQRDRLLDEIPLKARTGIGARPAEVRLRMILNLTNGWRVIVRNAWSASFAPIAVPDDDGFDSLCRMLLIKSEFWHGGEGNNHTTTIDRLIVTPLDPALARLYCLVAQGVTMRD